MFSIHNFPDELGQRVNSTLVNGILRGVEREALRITPEGKLAQTAHPEQLGSALTHPYITTDFSEALLEFITPPTHRVSDLFTHLDLVHRYVVSKLDNELLWTSSMPCVLPPDESAIPVALYGDSHNGQMKTVYRKGLGHRYGRSMQTVAGIHYNFSLPNAFWAYFHAKENSLLSLEAYKDQRYFAIIRNFRRHFWLLILLFGASPAMCSSFVGGRNHDLEIHPASQALYRPHATSLRMGDLGYQSSAQESLFICYNQKSSYISTLAEAILKPHPAYQNLALLDEHGDHQQLNQGLLQIENEFYSSIRPKRSAKLGETALTALHRRGVEYIEVRCLDINPFSPLGITEEQVAFVDTFLLFCALSESPQSCSKESAMILNNQKAVVNRGREPGLQLEHFQHGTVSMTEWATSLLDAMQPVAELLDTSYERDRFTNALATQRAKIEDTSLTPSAQILAELDKKSAAFPSVSMAQAQTNHSLLTNTPLDDDVSRRYEDMAIESLAEQKAVEERCSGSFDDFLAEYYEQYQDLLPSEPLRDCD